MHQLESEGKLELPEEQEARSFMISSIDAAFESPAFSALCKNAVLSPTDENVWSLVAFEKQIRNSDTVMLLATSSACMNRLWQLLMGLQSHSASGRLANHIDLLKMGHPLDDASRDRLTQALSLFCGCLVASVTSVDDSDFVAGHSNIVFSSSKLTEVITVIRDVGLGLIDLAFPEDFFVTAKAAEERHRDAAKVVVTRRSFLPPRRRGFGMEAQQRMFTPFSFVRGDSSDSDDEAGPSHDLPATSADMRNLSIIRSIPFVVPFMQRVKIFQDLLAHDREANDIVDDFHSFAGIGSRRHGITIAVRRQHLYEDAFEALSLGNAPNLRLPIRVSMTNWVGLNEVGIDGVSDEERFLLLSACAGYKQAMHQLESEGKLELLEEQEARSFMISSIDAAFESPAFSALCKNAVLSPTDENVWSLVAFEKQIRNSDTVMLLATSPACMNRLWQLLMGLQSRSASGRLANHIDLLKMGHPLDDASRDRLTQALSLFCGCLVASVTSVDDSDFVAGHSNVVFSSSKLTEVITVIRDVGLGLIDLAFPEDFFVTAKAAEERHRDAAKWSNLYETVVTTLQSLYAKDSRVHFLPHEFWSNHQRQVVVTRRSFLPPRRRGFGMEAQQRMFTPFSFVRGDSSDSDDEAGPSHDLPATSADMRNLSIIRSIPFVVPFMQRVKIFQDLLAHDREANDIVDDFHSFAGIGSRRHGITIAVRRQHLYEDAFEALSLGNAPNLRLPIRVSMTNWVGLNEVGIDGGGIFRRLIYEKQMAEIRFAEFFVAQLLGRRQTDVDLHHMKSYDPAIYKHLKNLRSLTADELAALELDFSVIVDDVGDVQTVDLIPGGRNIRVTVDNRLEYIRTYVNLFLYKRIEPLVDAMRAGVSTVIDPGWLAMFSPSELQTLVSGADADLDVDDMMKHTAVHNIRDEADRDYMNLFWSVVSEMSPEDKRGLLKFITGCSRPPIEGFKMLYPAIGIQLVHDSDHLPTSATCMNLFKLPIYSSRAKLEDKLRFVT
ncbi:HECT-domain protein [Ancylostoma duodenale]|uniref:HECT-type E3 ubiquitin transferase n=2 Tax=Ancylostoma TaxID=29169 RepID=A0A0C2DPD7_9BILA|nr:HECT-domain protein [Ancylostoma duodenale]